MKTNTLADFQICISVPLNMSLIKAKGNSKHLSKRCRKLQKMNFVGLMIRFSYFLNQLVNTNVSVKIKD